jgi:hypothetical protein
MAPKLLFGLCVIPMTLASSCHRPAESGGKGLVKDGAMQIDLVVGGVNVRRFTPLSTDGRRIEVTELNVDVSLDVDVLKDLWSPHIAVACKVRWRGQESSSGSFISLPGARDGLPAGRVVERVSWPLKDWLGAESDHNFTRRIEAGMVLEIQASFVHINGVERRTIGESSWVSLREFSGDLLNGVRSLRR